MKTAEERAREFTAKNEHLVNGNTKLRLELMIELYLKQQDRDTRHACAEELLKVKRYGGADEPLIILHEAQSTCMNVKAV